MKRTRMAATGIAVLAMLTLASACTTKTSAATPGPTKAAADLLTEAAEKTKGQSFTYTLTYGTVLTGDGARDATGANTQRNVTVTTGATGLTIKAKLLHIADKVYAKLDLGSSGLAVPGLGGIGDRWLAVDPTRLSPDGLSASLIPTADSSSVETAIKGVVSAEAVSPTEIKGRLDISKSAPIALPASELAKLTADQKNVPFDATLDSSGRITKIVIDLPPVAGYPAAPLTTTYSGFGSAVVVEAPSPDQIVSAPETIYLLLP